MTKYQKQKLGDICRIEKGRTGIASAVPGEYPLVSSSGHGKKSLKNVHY